MTVFTPRNFVADFLQAKCGYTRKMAVFLFEPPFGGLVATYDVHLRLVIGQRVVDFQFGVDSGASCARTSQTGSSS